MTLMMRVSWPSQRDPHLDHLEELQEERLLSDPYANVFFSKDRVEKIIEPVEEDIWASIAVPGLSGKQERVRILGRGEWMSGCPESSA